MNALRIICAPDSFKGTLSAPHAAAAMAAGVERLGSHIVADQCPVADGGEGTLEALITACGGAYHAATVSGPLGQPVEARFGVLNDGRTGVVGMAQASGLTLVPIDQRDPTHTTTYGTGELIRRAIDAGCETIIVGVGGSATCDGGAGIAQALGAKFFDVNGELITAPLTGGMLHQVLRVEPASVAAAIRVACDVLNPLTGENGAAAVYAPQKGATPEQVILLDAGLEHLAEIAGAPVDVPRSGAAGGAGWGMSVFAGATMESGADLILDAIDFDARCHGADLVITGEGCLDGQSMQGKITMRIAERARRLNVPVAAIVGRTGPGYESLQLDACISLVEQFGEDKAMNETEWVIAEAAYTLAQSRFK